ncbi:MAG TPA: hypothetical protein VMW95_07775 [Desulfobacterales bacterium]|nr:hypothetical protein [Desulfobacterales bacterium]
MVKFPVKYFNKIVPDAFHGTRLEHARKIHQDKKFMSGYNEKSYLGDGVYFYESSLEYAKIWARKNSNNGRIGVIRSYINLGRCLDLHDREHLDFLRKTASDLSERTEKTISDAFVINFVAEITGNKIDTVRATYTRNIKKFGTKVFSGSHFYYENELIICVRNLKNILTFSLIYRGG